MSGERCGLKSILINGQEYIDKFYEVTSDEAIGNGETIQIMLQEDDRDAPLDWTPRYAPCRLIDNNDVTVFFGMTKTKQLTQISGNVRYTQITAVDWKIHYANTPVYITFDPAIHTIRTALLSLCAQYASSDILGFVGYWNDPAQYVANGASFAEVVKALLSTVTDEAGAQWVITYDSETGKPIHNFIPVWQEHIGTIGNNDEVHDDSTLPFVVDEGAIKNIVHITAKNIRWPIKAEQWHYFAYDTQLEIYDPVEFMFGKALAAQPENMQVFLLVGSLNEDLSKVQGARLIELKVKTVNPDDSDAVGFNILSHLAKVDRRFMGDDFSGGTIARGGNTTLTPVLDDQNQWQILQTSLIPAPVLEYGTGAVTNPYDGEVQDYIIGCYSDAFAVSYQSNPYQDNPETVYGLLSLFKIEHLKENIKALSEAVGTNIEPDNLLGYYITYDFRSDYTVPFINQESIDKYGPQLAPDVNFDVDDIDTINFYGEKKIQQLSEERENGKFTYDHWHEGQELFDEWPRPGQLCDVKLGPYGLKEDVQIRTVRRHWKAGYCEVSIESMFSPTYGLIENLVKRIETVASNKNSKTASAIASILKISDHIVLSDSVRIYTVDKNHMRFRGQRLWELEFV